MSSSFRGIEPSGSNALAYNQERLGVEETKYNAESRANEILKTVGEGKTFLSGKELGKKIIGNIKQKAKAKANQVLKDAKSKVEGKVQDLKTQAEGKAKSLFEKAGKEGDRPPRAPTSQSGKDLVKRGLKQLKGKVEDKVKSTIEDNVKSTIEDKIAPSIAKPLENVAAEESTALRTTNAASRGEQIANEMRLARETGETGDVALKGGEDALRVGQNAGKAAQAAEQIPPPPTTAPPVGQPSTLEEAKQAANDARDSSQAEQQAAKAAEQKAGLTAEQQVAKTAEADAAKAAEKIAARKVEVKVGEKAVAKGAKVAGEVDADGGGPEDPIGDVIGAVAGIATTVYSLFHKPKQVALSNLPVNVQSQSFQVGF
tara:strand:+ start:1996 stop:3111 length:1116 start_codon:yes stop_codon:yes gene_type:complete